MTTAAAKSSPNSNLIYLFALGATGLATGVQFAAESVPLYLGIVALGGIAGMIISRAGLGKATLAFLATSIVAALVYYFVIAKMLQGAAVEAAAGETLENQQLAAAGGEAAGSALGALVAVWAFVQTFIPGFLGSAIGALVRPKRAAHAARTSQPAMA